MLRALAVHGPEAVRWLRGMFTFAIWDADQGRLRLARDPLRHGVQFYDVAERDRRFSPPG